MRRFSEKTKPPRTVFVKWPFGHPLGEPFNVTQQRTMLITALNALFTIKKPGEIIDIPFRWRKEQYNMESISLTLKSFEGSS